MAYLGQSQKEKVNYGLSGFGCFSPQKSLPEEQLDFGTSFKQRE